MSDFTPSPTQQNCDRTAAALGIPIRTIRIWDIFEDLETGERTARRQPSKDPRYSYDPGDISDDPKDLEDARSEIEKEISYYDDPTDPEEDRESIEEIERATRIESFNPDRHSGFYEDRLGRKWGIYELLSPFEAACDADYYNSHSDIYMGEVFIEEPTISWGDRDEVDSDMSEIALRKYEETD